MPWSIEIINISQKSCCISGAKGITPKLLSFGFLYDKICEERGELYESFFQMLINNMVSLITCGIGIFFWCKKNAC